MSRSAPRKRLAVVLVLLAGAGASACGGGGDPGASATTAPSAIPTQRRMVQVVADVSPSVVQIKTRRGLGSGVVYDDDGHVVSNAHVVASSARVQVTGAKGKRFTGRVMGADAVSDIAVVKVDGSGLRGAAFGSTTDLEVGDIVLAIGNPLGLRSSVTNGIVSALNRTVAAPNATALPNMIQTSAPINPGNSGGALVDLSGEVVGIPTLAARDPELGGSAPGIGFAIPSDTVRDLAGQIIEHGRVVNSHRAYLGVRVIPSYGRALTGAVVVGVDAGGPAADAGLRRGDVIVAAAGTEIRSPAALGVALAKRSPGQEITIRYRRDGMARTARLTLGEYPIGDRSSSR